MHIHHTSAEPIGVFTSLAPELTRAVRSQGYTTPTPVQHSCIPHALKGKDLLGTAQTGTGKTAAFALPILHHLRNSRGAKTPGALIVAPTRELAAQIDNSFKTYGRYLQIRSAVIFGGVNQNSQVSQLRRGVDILTATPGRLLDLMGQGHVDLAGIRFLVLDEVDRMLDMGFIEDIRKIVRALPASRQTMFFSATMAGPMEKLANGILTDPVRISISPEAPAVETISQKVIFVEKTEKDELLASILSDPSVSKAIVFTQMKHTANKVTKKLCAGGFSGTALHGNKSQAARTKSLDGFRADRYSILVATDVAARGLDVDSVSHVINYDLPAEAETYVHRIGRTARAGAQGKAISFCTGSDRPTLRSIEKLLGKRVPVSSF